MNYTFDQAEAADLDIAIFTKRLDTLLASATDFDQEAERLPSALRFLSEDDHLSAPFRAKLVAVLDQMNEASIAGIQPALEQARKSLRDLNERASRSDLNGSASKMYTHDRRRYEDYIADLEKKRKQKAKFPTRSTLEAFTAAVAEAQLVPEIYVLALQNGFNTNATLRKILQSLLSLWGFENQLR